MFFGAETDHGLLTLLGSRASCVGAARFGHKFETEHGLDYYRLTALSAGDKHPRPEDWKTADLPQPPRTRLETSNFYKGIETFNRYYSGVATRGQRLEVFARTLEVLDDGGQRLAIASPLYVAVDDMSAIE